jgi:hypothetical protein
MTYKGFSASLVHSFFLCAMEIMKSTQSIVGRADEITQALCMGAENQQ